MSLLGLRIIGLILGTLFGVPKPAVLRVGSPPHRHRGGRFGCLFLIMGVVIAGPSRKVMATLTSGAIDPAVSVAIGVVTGITEPNVVSVNLIAQPDTALNGVTVSQNTQDAFAYPTADLNTANLAGPIPTEPLYSNSLLTDAATANKTTNELDPTLGDLSNDLFNDLYNDPYINLFVLGNLYLRGEDLQIGFENTLFVLPADSFLTIPEPTSAVILGCSVLGLLANSRGRRNRSSSLYTHSDSYLSGIYGRESTNDSNLHRL